MTKLVQQVIFDTGVRVHPLEIDEIYRDGKFNQRRTRPVIVTFTKISTRDEIIKNCNNIKKKPQCKDIWVNEVVNEHIRQQRNELHALHLLAVKNGHQSKHVMDILTIDGITYNHNTISRLPKDLNLENAYSRDLNDHLFFNSEHVFLSNFHPCDIELEDVTCTSLEQAYFYLMAKEMGNMKAAHLILKTHQPREIKRIGSLLNVTQKWLDKADQVMYDLLLIKYRKKTTLKAKLLATGTKKLVESTLNKYWGCGLTIAMIDKIATQQGPIKYPGKNWLCTQTEDGRRELME